MPARSAATGARLAATTATGLAVLAALGPTSALGLLLVAGLVAALALAGEWQRDARASRWRLLTLTAATVASGFAGSLRLELLAIAAVVLCTGMRSPANARSGLAGGGVLLLLASFTDAMAAELVVGWVIAALATLALLEVEARTAVPSLGAPPAPSAARAAAKTALAIALVLVLAPLAVPLLPSPSPHGTALGDRASASQAVPAMVRADSIDIGHRPDRGDQDRLLLTVVADQPSLWRAQTFDAFDGRTWRQSASGPAVTLPPSTYLVRDLSEGYAAGPDVVPVTELTQRVRVESNYLGLLVAAPTAVSVRAPVLLAQHPDGSVDLGSGLGRGASYTVVSERPAVTGDILRTNDPRAIGLLPDPLRRYLALPDTVDPRVEELAAQLDTGAASTYDLVLAIEDWLAANTEYTQRLPPLPNGADPVAQHLFVDRKGWCEQIATSTAVLLRARGVPARLATGFAPGDRSLLGDEFRVRAGDAHAWVEVWFPGVGWQGFDPTADVPLAGDVDDGWMRQAADALRRLLPWLGALAAVAVVAVVAAVVWARVAARRGRSWPARMTSRLERAGRRRGRPRRLAETPLEYAAALAGGPLPDDAVVDAGRAVTAAAYGGPAPDEDARRQLEAAVRAAERRHPPRRWWHRVHRREEAADHG